MTPDPLVLVPGLDGTGELFYRQIPVLERQFRVSTFVLPDDSRATMEDLVSELLGFLDRKGLEGRPVYLCGESFGGALSLSFALAHPERAKGLVILNSFSHISQRVRIRLAPPLLKLLPWGAMRLVRRFTGSRLHTSTTLAEDIEEFHRRTLGIGREGYIRRLEILREYDIRGRLHEIAVPTLFLAADEDRLVPAVREARFMSSRMPNASMKVLEGFGHVCMIHHGFDLLSHIAFWLENGG